MSKSVCSTGLRWLWVVVAVLIIDLGSKFLILQNFALGDTVSVSYTHLDVYKRQIGCISLNAFSAVALSPASIAAYTFLMKVRIIDVYKRQVYSSCAAENAPATAARSAAYRAVPG